MTIYETLKERLSQRKSERSQIDSVYQELSEFITPNRGDFTVKNSPGRERHNRVFDDTATYANGTYAAMLQMGLVNPFSKWFSLTPTNLPTEFAESIVIQRYLDELNDLLFETFNDPDGGFEQQVHQMFLDLGAYGTAVMFIDTDENGNVRYNTRHLSEVYIEENHVGKVDIIYREFEFTARQIASKWGEEKLPPEVKRELMAGSQTKYKIVHCVLPTKDYERMSGTSVPKHLKRFDFISTYFLGEKCVELEISGFYEFPFVVARWDVLVGEIYGRSPGWSALPSIRMVNTMAKTALSANQKALDPVLLVADDGVMFPMRTHPGGVIVGGVDPNGGERVRPLQAGGQVQLTQEMLEYYRSAIRRMYYVDLVTDRNTPYQTATGVLDQRDIENKIFGPQMARIRAEMLDVIIKRTFNLLERSGKLPPAPEELEGVSLKIEYTSPLMREQKTDELNGLNAALNTVSVLLQGDPTLLDNVDGDDTFRTALMSAGFPASKVRTREEVEELRQQRQEAAQQMQQMEMLNSGADTVNKLSQSGVLDGA